MQSFDVKHDGVGFRVHRNKIQYFPKVDIGADTGGNQAGKSDIVDFGPVQDRRAQGA